MKSKYTKKRRISFKPRRRKGGNRQKRANKKVNSFRMARGGIRM